MPSPRPSLAEVHARVTASLYEAAEDHGVAATTLRRAVLSVLDAPVASRATLEEARDAVAIVRSKKTTYGGSP